MRATIRRAWLTFLTGFVLAFIGYLFVEFDTGEVILGIIIAAASGAGLVLVLGAARFWWRRRGGEEPPAPAPESR